MGTQKNRLNEMVLLSTKTYVKTGGKIFTILAQIFCLSKKTQVYKLMGKIYAQKVSSSGPKTKLISGGCWDGTPATSGSYVGKVSRTEYFIPCQAWASQDPQTHDYTDADFPLDGSLAAAENYCRDPGGVKSRPWCYRNVHSGSRWDYCDTECNGISYMFMF